MLQVLVVFQVGGQQKQQLNKNYLFVREYIQQKIRMTL